MEGRFALGNFRDIARKLLLKLSTMEYKPAGPEGYRLDLTFIIARDVRSEDYARRFFSILSDRNGRFLPNAWEHPDKAPLMKLDLAHLEGPIEEWKSHRSLLMSSGNRHDPRLYWHIRTCGWAGSMPFVSVDISEELLGETEADFDDLLGLGLDLYGLVQPVYGNIHMEKVPWTSTFYPPITSSIPDISWVNFFGVPYVQMLGEERIRTSPSHRVEKLCDGGYMLQLSATPRESVSVEGRALADRVKTHLGENYFYHPEDGREYAGLKQRTVPNFDRDSIPFARPMSEPAEIHKEYVPDAERFIEDVPLLVEGLRSRTELADKLDFTQSSLQLLDSWLAEKWEETASAEFWESVDLVQELAAYAGEVVLRARGGKWAAKQLKSIGPAPVVEINQRRLFDPIPPVVNVVMEGIQEEQGYLLEASLAGHLPFPK